MTRLLSLLAGSALLLSSVGCCCLSQGHGACYPPAGGCPGGNCGVGYGAAAAGPGVAQQGFYDSYAANQYAAPQGTFPTTTGPVALGPIIPGPVAYVQPTTTTTFVTPPYTSTAALQPLPTY